MDRSVLTSSMLDGLGSEIDVGVPRSMLVVLDRHGPSWASWCYNWFEEEWSTCLCMTFSSACRIAHSHRNCWT